MTTAKQSSLSRIDRGAEVAIGPAFFIVAILGILASAIAVGGGSLARPTGVPDTVTVKMNLEQDTK